MLHEARVAYKTEDVQRIGVANAAELESLFQFYFTNLAPTLAI